MNVTAPAAERFWSKVKKTPTCWLWEGALRNGYGCWKYNGQAVSAHRTAFEWEYGEIPTGMVIHNTCGNRTCVRTSHLRLYSYAQNTAAAIASGHHHLIGLTDNHARGERVGVSKLKPDQVYEIRQLHSEQGIGSRRLGRKFGVSKKSIELILKGKTWRHL